MKEERAPGSEGEKISDWAKEGTKERRKERREMTVRAKKEGDELRKIRAGEAPPPMRELESSQVAVNQSQSLPWRGAGS